jgi:tetratricopeptide (TPR) repeat protein
MPDFKTIVLSAALFCLSVSARADNASHNYFALAENDYKEKKFEQALRGFDQALRDEASKNKVLIHYMKANCLVQMDQPGEADKEYAIAQSLAPGSQVARYCEVARANIKRLSLTQNAASRVTSTKNKVQADDEDDDENTDDQKTTAVSVQAKDNPAVSAATLALIVKQAALARKRALEIGDVAAENERIKAANEARSLQAKLERAASTPRGGTEPVALTHLQIEVIKSQAAAGSEQLRQVGEWKAQQRKQESEDKSEEIRRQAENLQSQLINYRPNINSDIKLNPVGTNLYIRNYSKGINPITPLQAQTKALPSYKSATEGIKGTVLSKQTSLNKVDGRGTSSVTSSSSKVDGHYSVASVKGQLIGRQKPTQAEHP